MRLRIVLPFACCASRLVVPHNAFAQPDETPSLPPLPAPQPPPPATAPRPAALPPVAPARSTPPSDSSNVPKGHVPDEPEPPLTLATLPKLLVASVGMGFSSASADGERARSQGFYTGGEFVLVPSMWFSPRLYAGLLITSPDEKTCYGAVPCDVEAKIGFVGVKGRFTIPIPYVAPFIELGLGMSAGTLRMQTPTMYKNFTGVTYHVPFALGLSIGKVHHYVVDVAFAYLFHPEQAQVDGAFAVSLAFPIR